MAEARMESTVKNKRSYKEILNDAIASLNSKQEELSQLTETYKKKGYELPTDFPDLSKLIEPFDLSENDGNELRNVENDGEEEILNLKEPTFDESSLRKIEKNLLRAQASLMQPSSSQMATAPPRIYVEPNDDCDLKEPVFDETELSAAGQLMLEAHKLGIPFDNLKFTPKKKNKKMPLTPDSETFQMRTVSQIILTPGSTYIYGRSSQTELAASPVLLNRAEVPAENEEEPLTVLQSPEEPELEWFHKVDDSVPMSEILKEPESPELSDFLKSLQAKGLV